MNGLTDEQRACCAFLFDELSIRSELIQDGTATRTGDRCHRTDCNGSIWDTGTTGTELICDSCSTVVNMSTAGSPTRRAAPPEWESFWSNRSRYHTSGRIRCVGGFPVYEWGEDSE
jgi:hypothetical protein